MLRWEGLVLLCCLPSARNAARMWLGVLWPRDVLVSILLRRLCIFCRAHGSPWCRVRFGPMAERVRQCRLTAEAELGVCVRQVTIDDMETVDAAYFKSDAWLNRGIDRMAITLLRGTHHRTNACGRTGPVDGRCAGSGQRSRTRS